MRLFLALASLALTHGALANPASRETLLHQLKSVQSALLDGKTNLSTSDENLQKIDREYEKLKQLETEHVQLKADIQEQIKANPNNDKGKVRQSFLFQAGKLEGEVNRQLLEIKSRFVPLLNEKTSWTERKTKYETLVSELAKKETQIQEQLSLVSNSAAGTEAPPVATPAPGEAAKPQP